METEITARTSAELPALLSALRGGRARLSDVISTPQGLNVPFEYPDSANTRVRACLPGMSPGSVPLLQAHLFIGNVLSHESEELDRRATAGPLFVGFDEDAGRWTLSVPPHSEIHVSVEAINASIVITDHKVGDQPLATVM
jgi:hypothetical protein